ncbi:M56 family metallopeptidase [Marinimicrobium locisalis]|uniref:M56 family metallopeptidase n=1 Tax=Marinimicrobium locisalis TaxID=546022 RepID=UPI003221E64A
MTVWLDFLYLLALGALLAWLPASGLLWLAGRWLSRDFRSRHLWLLSLTPWLAMATPVTAMCITAAGKPLGWITDHCIHHGTHHPHLCFEHWPALDWQWIHLFGAAALASLSAKVLAGFLQSEHRAARDIAALRALSRGRGRLRRLDTPEAFACTAGYRYPTLFMSRGLTDRLDYRERRIVLAHEVAHLRQRDPLRHLLFNVLLLAHWPCSARALGALWRQRVEEQADDRAALRFGPDAVAATLIKVARLSGPAPAGSLSANGGHLLTRIHRLLHARPGTPAGATPVTSILTSATFLAGVTAIVVAHHSLETLLGFLVGV